MKNERLDAALSYASRGWPVFPCHAPTRHGCSCGQVDCSSPAKHPATTRGLRDASTNPRRIERWWRQRPEANVAIRTGAPGDLVVIDVDLPHGPASLATVIGAHPPSVRTGSGGEHHYFTSAHEGLRNSAGRLGPGLDVRATGGYVIAPPSRHINGEPYRWMSSPLQIPRLPDVVERDLIWTPSPATSHRRDGDMNAWAVAVLEHEVCEVRRAPEGTRNHTLNRAAFRLGRLAARGEVDAGQVRSDLQAAARQAGLGQREAERTTESGLSAGLRHGLGRSLSR